MTYAYLPVIYDHAQLLFKPIVILGLDVKTLATQLMGLLKLVWACLCREIDKWDTLTLEQGIFVNHPVQFQSIH